MDALNSTESRKLSPVENMQRLEKAVVIADQRIRMRREVAARASITLGLLVAVPLSTYLLYHWFAPGGVMQNYKASSGAYMFWAQNFMYRPKSQTAIYRPEINLKEQSGSLHKYTQRVAAKRVAGELPEGVHHPSMWH